MGSSPNDLDNEWSGLEPKQPRSRAWGCWLGGILLIIILLVACGSLVFLAWDWLSPALESGPILGVPTPITATAIPGDPINGETGPISPTPELKLAATATLQAGGESSTLEIGQTASPPLIDGNLSDWGDFAVYESRYQVFAADGWDGSDDVLAAWRLSWDSANLYLAVSVEDDQHVQTQTGSQVFRGDGVSLQIDTQRAADFGPGLNEDDFQINLSPGNFSELPPSAYRFKGNNSGALLDAPGQTIVVMAQKSDQGYLLEAAIPWRDLNLRPAPGMVVGLALNVNDNDTPGTAVQEVMKSHVPTRRYSDPSSWGTLTLR